MPIHRSLSHCLISEGEIKLIKRETILYDTHEKRKMELHNYLVEFKVLDKIAENILGKILYHTFRKYNDDIYDTAIELGYNILDICKSMPKNYYVKHPEAIKEKLLSFIEEHKRFPKYKELQKMHVNVHYIKKFGGIDEFKKLIQYDDSKDLIDLRGDYNKSLGELITANYLCSQGLKDKYAREKHPFPVIEGYFRSDFSFLLDDNKEIHIEVWGYKRNGIVNKIAQQYNDIRKIKENLYYKYSNNIILISINYEIFDMKYDDIQKNLYELIAPYLKLKFKDISYKKLLSASILNDDELFNEVMKISPDGITLPSTSKLLIYSSGAYTQILKRGYSYYQFAKKYGVKTNAGKNKWTKELIYEYFKNIINKGDVINKKTMNNYYSGLSEATEKYGYMTKMKIDYFMKIHSIPSQELNWVINLANNITNTNAIYSKNEVEKAKRLLNKQITLKESSIINNYKQCTSL